LCCEMRINLGVEDASAPVFLVPFHHLLS